MNSRHREAQGNGSYTRGDRNIVLKEVLGFFTLLTAILAVFVFQATRSAAYDPMEQPVNLTYSLTVDDTHPAKAIEFVFINGNAVSVLGVQDISVDEARSRAGQPNDASSDTRTDFPVNSSPPPVITRVCHTYGTVHDPEPRHAPLTEVEHETEWDFNGNIVGLKWMRTSAGWHWSTGWSLVSGPSQQVIEGNGGWSDQTHGEATFDWDGGQHRHNV